MSDLVPLNITLNTDHTIGDLIKALTLQMMVGQTNQANIKLTYDTHGVNFRFSAVLTAMDDTSPLQGLWLNMPGVPE